MIYSDDDEFVFSTRQKLPILCNVLLATYDLVTIERGREMGIQLGGDSVSQAHLAADFVYFYHCSGEDSFYDVCRNTEQLLHSCFQGIWLVPTLCCKTTPQHVLPSTLKKSKFSAERWVGQHISPPLESS